MELGIFNSLYLPRHLTDVDPDGAEAKRLLDEVAWTEAADRAGFKYTWATEHHFLTEYSHLSANESFLAYLAGVTTNIPSRQRHHQHHAAGKPSGSDRGAGCDDRPPVAVAGSSSAWDGARRAPSSAGFGITDPEMTKLMFDEVVPQFRRMWERDGVQLRGRVLLDADAQRAAEADTKPHPPMWVAAGNPSTFEKAGPDGSGRAVLPHRSPRGACAAHRDLQEDHR